MESQVCGMCGEEKPLESFNKNKIHTNGRYTYCRSCISAHNRQIYLKTREEKIKKVIARQKEVKKIEAWRTKNIKREKRGYPPLPFPKPKEKKKRRATLKEYRDIIRTQPISVSDLID